MPLDVEDIATDADLGNEAGGFAKIANLLAKDWNGSGKPARQAALDHVLLNLSRRTPPILEGNLDNAAELKLAVVYGALERIYRRAITDGGDVFSSQRKVYEKLYGAELGALTPTVSGGSRGAPLGIAFHRR